MTVNVQVVEGLTPILVFVASVGLLIVIKWAIGIVF
jgi:hypothetical protein